MKKRAQVTIFIILGIVIVALAVLFLTLRQTVLLPTTPENLNKELESIKNDITKCLTEASDEPIILIGRQGGYLATPADTYRLYNDNKISYLCYNIPEKPNCYNRILLIEQMEGELNEAIEFNIKKCLDVKQYEKFKPYLVLAPSNATINTNIRKDNVLVTLNYPITLQSKKTATAVSMKEFSTSFNYPLGLLYDVAQEILDYETEFGYFDVLTYMLSKKGSIKIYPAKPYPDKVYTLKKEGNEYIFQFAVQGEAS